jgi:hypothetical protein
MLLDVAIFMKVLLDIDSGTVRPSNYDRILSSAFGEEAYWYKERDCSCRKQGIYSGFGKKPVRDHFATVKLLLDLGAHANYTKSFSPDSRHKPILLALFKCSSISNGIVKLLVERGANVNSEELLHGFIEAPTNVRSPMKKQQSFFSTMEQISECGITSVRLH